MKHTYLVQWKNGTISVLTATSKKDLILRADLEGNIAKAKVTRISDMKGNVYLGTEIATHGDPAIVVVDVENGLSEWKRISIKGDLAWDVISACTLDGGGRGNRLTISS